MITERKKIMSENYFFTKNVTELIKEIPADSIVSRTFYEADRLKAILFGFAPGQELSEHTAARPAILHFLQGEADLTLGEDAMSVQSGSLAYMQPHLSHSIVAKSEVIMLLYLL
jgi:quercetin dioxygenase-like cupin family protein